MSLAETLAARAAASTAADPAPLSDAAKDAADAFAAKISPLQSAPTMPTQEELDASYMTQLAEMYPEGSYLMKTQRVLLLKNGGKVLPDANGVITAADKEQLEMLAYWDNKAEGLVLKLK